MFGKKKKPPQSKAEAEAEQSLRKTNTNHFLSDLQVKDLEGLKSKISETDDYQRSVLHIALEYEVEPKVIAFLLKNGADVNAKDDNGDSPLHYAAQSGDIESVNLLLKKGADPSATNTYAKTPLSEINAKKKPHPPELYEALINAGGTGCFWEPLDFMPPKLQQALIKLGVKHYSRTEMDSQKNTLLHWCAQFGLTDEAKTLLDKGISPTLKNKHGKTPLMIAEENEQMAIATLIKGALAK